ncbi:hypothetical protein [Kribbella jiaozuonensis]|uniref:Uncharacterized protein n=1 Tax=Kribbella jiaozuonensis TaxID=2575441 RepID=A0A4U3M408_9ACTN|nr:hypothetical protein [Kribbella jiaozuonensis]TKK82057.1 hypothetical protein FDA38_04335 [Kribbella jiaozuonensis]
MRLQVPLARRRRLAQVFAAPSGLVVLGWLTGLGLAWVLALVELLGVRVLLGLARVVSESLEPRGLVGVGVLGLVVGLGVLGLGGLGGGLRPESGGLGGGGRLLLWLLWCW